MARLIDANALKGDFMFLRKMWSGTEIMAVIDDAPTVDVAEMKWIPVSERLPIELLMVIICVPRKQGIAQVLPAYLASGWWTATNDWCYGRDEVTHWMPLPQPPKGE